jgi:hypothetical protein
MPKGWVSLMTFWHGKPVTDKTRLEGLREAARRIKRNAIILQSGCFDRQKQQTAIGHQQADRANSVEATAHSLRCTHWTRPPRGDSFA